MKAYLTFVRQKNFQDLSFLGIKNPINISDANSFKLISGQPIIAIIKDNTLLALYLIDSKSELFQVLGEEDYLFMLKYLEDYSNINLAKYNYIRQLLLDSFSCLSISELEAYDKEMKSFEDKIFYELLHTELDYIKIKNHIMKEIKKLSIDLVACKRMIESCKNSKQLSLKQLRKKVDVDLSGYGIYINSFVSQSN